MGRVIRQGGGTCGISPSCARYLGGVGTVTWPRGGVCGAPGALLSALLSAPAQSLRDRSPAAGTELSLTPPSMSSVSVSSQVSERDGGTGAAVRLIYKVFEFMT